MKTKFLIVLIAVFSALMILAYALYLLFQVKVDVELAQDEVEDSRKDLSNETTTVAQRVKSEVEQGEEKS